ncbi:WSC domain-containing protein 2 [Aspergillus udagawae]|uniref:WSC domain-containing protein 2 n=1 Tax=Aspergillus udagawae TaxID=91492 RepID=A0A8H3N257_9EURO|nr:WSC domain-containing protein 2 [Aspergillus udagawae]
MSASSTRTTTGLSTASSTTSASTTSGMSASSTRTTTGLSTTSSTTSASSTTATATTASSSATSSVTSSSPIPTIVPQVDSFSFIGCFVDAWDARNLVAGSSEDSNPNGMTVEKCIALAQSGSWRYAGVEFGSQCFVGNTLHGGVQFPDSDCSMVCAGSPSETCGEAGRIQVYQDSTWSSPTLQELADAVRQYNSTVEEVRAAIADYKNVMDDLEHYLSSVSNVKRLNSQIEEFEMRVRKVDGNLQQGQGNLQAVRTKTDAALTKGRQLDTINQDNPSKVPDNIYEQWSGTGQLLQQVSEVRDLLKHNVVELEEAKAANNPKPPIEAVANAKKADVVLTSIGAIGGLAASGGFLFALAVIIKFFDRGGNTGTSPTTTTTTSPASISTLSTATTTSTTMTCTATAATTPVGIITKQGVSLAEFNELVVSLPKDPNAIQLTDSGQPNFLYLGYMDECTTEKLDNNPSVELWTIASGSQPIFALNHGGIPACQFSPSSWLPSAASLIASVAAAVVERYPETNILAARGCGAADSCQGFGTGAELCNDRACLFPVPGGAESEVHMFRMVENLN